MAGATATVLFPEVSRALFASWERIVTSRAVLVRGDDFWIAPVDAGRIEGSLPFHSRAADDSATDCELDWEAIDAVRGTFGFVPRAQIQISGMCRGRPSDQILGELVGAILSEHRGTVMFDGLLSPTLDPDGWKVWYKKPSSERAATFLAALGTHPGTIIAATVDGEASQHIADLAFLRFWMTHPAFHFVN